MPTTTRQTIQRDGHHQAMIRVIRVIHQHQLGDSHDLVVALINHTADIYRLGVETAADAIQPEFAELSLAAETSTSLAR